MHFRGEIMKKKGLLGLLLSIMLVAPVAGCKNEKKIEGVYTF